MLTLAVFLISAALLAYEVALMRILAITQWSHFAYLVISIALLGFGASGTLVAIGGAWLRRYERVALPILMGLFATSMLACVGWSQALDLNVLELPWQMGQVWTLLAVALILMIPFLLGAAAIVLTIASAPERSTGLYAANLLGSGVGAWGVVMLLWRFGPGVIPLILFWIAWPTAALCLGRIRSWRGQAVAVLVVAASVPVAFLAFAGDQGHRVRANPFKLLPQYLSFPEARTVAEATGPLGRLDVVASPSIHDVSDLSPRFRPTRDSPPPQMALFTDADSPSPINLWRTREQLRCFDYTTSAAPYHVRRPAVVCVIGAGGGTDLDLAYYHGCRRIHAVELNPRVLDVLRQARGRENQPYDPRVMDVLDVVVAEGRGYLERAGERFDLIQISLVDSFSASSAGVYALNESYLYTVEALRTYVRRLTPDGILSITRWQKRPARDVIKLFATAAEALEAEGLDPKSRLMLIRRLRTATLLVSSRPFTDDDVARLRAFCTERDFDLCYVPGIRAEEVNRYHAFTEPIYYLAAQAILSDRREAFTREYLFDVRPATDDRPFFFHFFRPRMLPRVRAVLGRNWRPFVEWGYVIVLVTVAAAVAASVILILLPLALARVRRPACQSAGSSSSAGARGGRWATVIYCLALGLAFMFIEIAFIQKFILFLSDPLYAISVIIAGFLVLAGLGSWLAGRLRWGSSRTVATATGIIVVVSVLYAVGLNPLLRGLIGWPDWARIATTVVLLVPLAVPMGMPFPTALRRLGRASPSLVPWAWGINGCASVTAAPLATALAVSFGFRFVIVAAALLYLAAAIVCPRLPRGA